MSGAGAPRGALALLVDPRFGAFFWSRLTSTIGIWLHALVAGIVVFAATGSAFVTGLVTAAQFAPQLLLGPLAGAWVDRGNPIAQIIVGRLLCALSSSVAGGWMVLREAGHVGEAGTPAVLVGACAVGGFGIVVGGPAMQSLAPELVRPGEAKSAIALNSAPMTVGRVAGPALGAMLLSYAGAGAAFAGAALLQLTCVALLVPLLGWGRTRQVDDDADHSVREALREVWRDRPLAVLLGTVAALGVGAEPTNTLVPAVADRLGGGASLTGVLATGVGVGAAVALLVSNLIAQRARHELVVAAGAGLVALSLAAAAFALPAWAMVVAFGANGMGFVMAVTSATTLIQVRVAPAMRGRVMALWLVGFIGTRPLAALLVGLLADHLSVPAAFAVISVVMAGAALRMTPARLGADRPQAGDRRAWVTSSSSPGATA